MEEIVSILLHGLEPQDEETILNIIHNVFPPLFLPICPLSSIRLSVNQFVCPYLCPATLSVNLFLALSVHPFILLSVCLPVCLPCVYPSVRLSVCLTFVHIPKISSTSPSCPPSVGSSFVFFYYYDYSKIEWNSSKTAVFLEWVLDA